MPTVEKIVEAMRSSQKGIRFSDCLKVCNHHFAEYGKPRRKGSHCVFHTPWQGDPRINIQDRGGYVVEYQVKQVLRAIDKLEGEKDA